MLLSGKFILIVWFVYPWFLAAEQWNLYPRQGTGPVSKIQCRARICKRLRSPGIDSEEPTPPAYVA